jgi:bifunctional DNA-binding transcriptional regulator/antitoxin component of YhaV-PrlF toxin-antitoxin module
MRITTKGQVTIPQPIREAAGFLPHTEVEFELDGASVRIVKARSTRKLTRGQLAVHLLRQAADQNKLTTDEIMALTRGEE